MARGDKELQRRMYLSVARAEYLGPAGRRRLRQRKAVECLMGHGEGCGCWRRSAGPAGRGSA